MIEPQHDLDTHHYRKTKKIAWHNQSAENVLPQLGSSATGLSTQEADQRLAADGAILEK